MECIQGDLNEIEKQKRRSLNAQNRAFMRRL